MSTADVIVVGAGITGLAAANHLRKAGRSVMVLEASARPGGRIIRMSRNGDAAEVGAQGVHNNYTEMLGIIDEVGLTPDLRPSQGDVRYFDRHGAPRITRGNLDLLKVLGPRGVADLIHFRTRYFTFAKRFPVFEIARDVPEYDNVTAEEEFSWAGRDFRDFVLRPMIHAMTASKPKYINLYHVINCLRQRLTTRVFTLSTGNVTLCERLADLNPVTYGAEVAQILTKGGKVDGVLLADGQTIKARHVIVACPIGTAARITPDEFGPAKVFLRQFTYTPVPLAVFFLDRPLPQPTYSFGHPFQDTTFNMTINHALKTPHLAPSGKAIISAWGSYPGTLDLEAMSDADVIAQAQKDLAIFYPSLAEWTEEARVMRHHWGFARYEPGMHRKVLDFKVYAATLDGISFAGNDYDSVHLESGVRSGLRAAARAMRC